MGLFQQYRAGVRAQGAERGYGALYIGPQERAGMDARLAAEGLSPVAEDAVAGMGQAQNPADRLSGRLLFRRSEEHTSELQSLMRISYAVFCLTKKTPLCGTTKKTESE